MYGLNHEVLYMAVKLIDLYLMKNQIAKDKFQLLASGAILLSSKIDVSRKEKKICLSDFILIHFVVTFKGERAWFPLRSSQTIQVHLYRR